MTSDEAYPGWVKPDRVRRVNSVLDPSNLGERKPSYEIGWSRDEPGLIFIDLEPRVLLDDDLANPIMVEYAGSGAGTSRSRPLARALNSALRAGGIPVSFLMNPYVTPEELKDWDTKRAGGRPWELSSIGAWVRFGFDADAARAWLGAGINTPHSAYTYSTHGLNPLGYVVASMANGDADKIGESVMNLSRHVQRGVMDSKLTGNAGELILHMSRWYGFIDEAVTELINADVPPTYAHAMLTGADAGWNQIIDAHRDGLPIDWAIPLYRDR